MEGARASLAAFGKTALDAGRDALTEFFDTGITGAKSFRDAFRDMALSIIADLRRMAAQLIATAIMQKIAGAFGGGGMVGGEGGEKKATGGLLGGAGTGTSDSNLAWFSRGEYLVRAAVVREPGVLRHLEDLNRRGVRALVPHPVVIEAPAPRFAEGGLVDRAAAASDAAPMDGRLAHRPRRGPRAAPARDLRRPAHPGQGHQQEPPRDPLGPGDVTMFDDRDRHRLHRPPRPLDAFLTSYGTAFGLTYAGVGDGRLTEYRGGGAAVAQTFTITATSATTFSVVGSVTGSHADATVGVPYSNPRVGFTIVDGATPFQAGDVFTLSTAPKWTTLRRSLGSKVLATQVNTGTYAAQNLVDGKPDGDTNNYWRVDSPITIPQDIEITLYQDGDDRPVPARRVRQLVLAGRLDLRLLERIGLGHPRQRDRVQRHDGRRHTFDIASPVAATRYRLHITKPKYTTAMMLGVIRLLRADGVDAAAGQMVWKAPGNDGDSEIYVGLKPFERADADYFDWELFGFDGFVDSSHLRLQPGAHGRLYLPLWDATIPYWFIADGRRVIVVAKINTQYEMAYLGLLDPYFSPEQWPYPLALGGTLALGETPIGLSSTLYRWSEASDKHRMPTHSDTLTNTPPNLQPEDAQLRARNLDGNWLPFAASRNGSPTSAPQSYESIIWPYRGGHEPARPQPGRIPHALAGDAERHRAEHDRTAPGRGRRLRPGAHRRDPDPPGGGRLDGPSQHHPNRARRLPRRRPGLTDGRELPDRDQLLPDEPAPDACHLAHQPGVDDGHEPGRRLRVGGLIFTRAAST